MHLVLNGYGMSLFPEEPEQRLHFDCTYLQKPLYMALLFFKTLGFQKPTDDVVRLKRRWTVEPIAVLVLNLVQKSSWDFLLKRGREQSPEINIPSW